MAQSLNTPDVLTQPIANNGTKNSIPDTNDQSLGLMSQSTGFPPICSERIADGGKAPRRADFNGAFNLLSQQHYFFQNGGTETFRKEVSDAIGGYPLNARLWYLNENGETYVLRSTKANNTDNFLINPSVIGDSWVYDITTTSYVNAKINEIRTNCITEIPQDIKLELNNGTLTLKSESVVTFADGSQYQLTSDKTRTSGGSGDMFVFYRKSGSVIEMPKAQCFSGTTQPTGVLYAVWYDTKNNIIKYTANSFSTWEECSFPICASTFVDNIPTSIDQVFNGFGYIGSTVFALPGVKGLIPNGRNADGSLKNVEFETTTVKITSNTGSGRDIFIIDKGTNFNRVPSSAYRFNIENNTWELADGSAKRYHCVCGTTTGDITSFTPKTTFRAVDYNDFKRLDDEAVKIAGNQTIGGDKTFTGKVEVPTPTSATDNSTNVATTAWFRNALTSLCPTIRMTKKEDIASNSLPYTATADGIIRVKIGATYSWQLMINGTIVQEQERNNSDSCVTTWILIPVKNGDVLTATGNAYHFDGGALYYPY